MRDLLPLSMRMGVILGVDGRGRFEHLATAWCVGRHEWVTAWEGEQPPAGGAMLMSPEHGTVAVLSDWEQEDGLAGFQAEIDVPALPTRTDGELRKKDQLWAIGFPSMIDHPAFRLSRGSLTPERYLPYCCPWVVSGHVALYSAEDAWLTGRCYRGLEGAPVLDVDGRVVGVLCGGEASPEHPPLARFRRLV